MGWLWVYTFCTNGTQLAVTHKTAFHQARPFGSSSSVLLMLNGSKSPTFQSFIARYTNNSSSCQLLLLQEWEMPAKLLFRSVPR